MGMKKSYKRIAVLSTLALTLGSAGSVFATVDMDSSTDDSATYATELAIDSAGTNLTNDGTLFTYGTTTTIGFSIGSGTSKYIRYEFANATLAVAVTEGDAATGDALLDSGIGDFNDDTGLANTYAISQGGSSGDDYVIIEVGAVGGDISQTDVTSVNWPTLAVTGESTVTIAYTLYETAVDAVNETNALATVGPENLISFSAGHAVSATSVSPGEIDVTAGSANFVAEASISSTTSNIIGNVVIGDVASDQYVIDGTTDYSVDTAAHVSAGTLVISGDFSAAQDLDGNGDPDGTYTASNVWIPAALDCSGGPGGTSFTTLTATEASLTLSSTSVSMLDSVGVCMWVNGESVIAEGTFTATFTPTNGSVAYDAGATEITLGTLEKNGSTATENFALTPGGSFSNYVRITNPSTVDGDVFIRLYQDDGTASSLFMLSDVDASFADQLDAKASTDQMTIQALYDASGLAAGYTGKLRIEAEGEFSSIDIQVYTVSLDGQNFSTF